MEPAAPRPAVPCDPPRPSAWRGGRLLVAAALLLGVLLAFAAPVDAAPRHRGLNMHLLWSADGAETERQLDLAADLGANVVRVDVGWQVLEQEGKGRYEQWYLDRIDRFVAGARARGIRVVLMLFTTPCWASSAPESIKQDCAPGWWERGAGAYPPNDPADFAAAARFLVSRYGDALAAFEVWNEPNEPGFFRAPDPAAAYAELLRATFPAVKLADPGIRVLAGSLAYGDDVFLRELYRHGIQGFYDALSVHPYAGPDGPGSYPFLYGLRWNIRGAQLEAGDTTPVWITEFGWNTSTASDVGMLSGVTEQTQADYLEEAWRLLDDPDSGLGFVEGALSYELRDGGTDAGDAQHRYGVVRPDYAPKPAFAALRAALGATPTAGGSLAGLEKTTSGGAPDGATTGAPAGATTGTSAPGTQVRRRLRVSRTSTAEAPRRLTVKAGRRRASLRWSSPGTKRVKGYTVYRRPEGGAGRAQALASTRARRFTDTRVRRGTRYVYWVRARDARGHPGRSSRRVIVRTR